MTVDELKQNVKTGNMKDKEGQEDRAVVVAAVLVEDTKVNGTVKSVASETKKSDDRETDHLSKNSNDTTPRCVVINGDASKKEGGVSELSSQVSLVSVPNKRSHISPNVCASVAAALASVKEGEDLSSIKLPHLATKTTCPICLKKCSSKVTLDNHIRVEHGTCSVFRCGLCKKEYAKKSRLMRHFMTHAGLKPHKCPYCPKRFSQRSDLTMHIRIHTGERPFKCVVCPKSFTQKVHLTVHMRVHTGERPFGCAYCMKRFATKANLKSHCRTHSGDRPYTCHICKKSFSERSKLCVHFMDHSFGGDSHDIAHQCPLCLKFYMSKGFLERHMREHALADPSYHPQNLVYPIEVNEAGVILPKFCFDKAEVGVNVVNKSEKGVASCGVSMAGMNKMPVYMSGTPYNAYKHMGPATNVLPAAYYPANKYVSPYAINAMAAPFHDQGRSPQQHLYAAAFGDMAVRHLPQTTDRVPYVVGPYDDAATIRPSSAAAADMYANMRGFYGFAPHQMYPPGSHPYLPAPSATDATSSSVASVPGEGSKLNPSGNVVESRVACSGFNGHTPEAVPANRPALHLNGWRDTFGGQTYGKKPVSPASNVVGPNDHASTVLPEFGIGNMVGANDPRSAVPPMLSTEGFKPIGIVARSMQAPLNHRMRPLKRQKLTKNTATCGIPSDAALSTVPIFFNPNVLCAVPGIAVSSHAPKSAVSLDTETPPSNIQERGRGG